MRDAKGQRLFSIALSVEKEAVAHRTLRFRAFLRQFGEEYPKSYFDFLNGKVEEPDWEESYPDQWNAACQEAKLLELGAPGTADELNPILDRIVAGAGARTIVIGGPPCQAYSMVGRARNKAKVDYEAGKDERHFLYRQYIEILERVRPCAFVMENVKGILSSAVNGNAIFEQVLADLGEVGGSSHAYELLAFVAGDDGAPRLVPTRNPRRFVIHAEKFGVPQARHRVIIVGVRRDLFPDAVLAAAFGEQLPMPVAAKLRHVLSGMPPLRSGLSKADSEQAWVAAMKRTINTVEAALTSAEGALALLLPRLAEVRSKLEAGAHPSDRSSDALGILPNDCPDLLREWIVDPRLQILAGHASRGHMEADLARYLFSSLFSEESGRSPVAKEFPAALAPLHRNWDTGHFADRFRTQPWELPSTTVTSHIAKDGHYFIHPDPIQCRALTVREAARLQTFPDNYRFFGNRTEQFVQVGNAVPPFLARQIGSALLCLLQATPAEFAQGAIKASVTDADADGEPAREATAVAPTHVPPKSTTLSPEIVPCEQPKDTKSRRGHVVFGGRLRRGPHRSRRVVGRRGSR